MSKVVKIFSKQKIEVVRELAFADKSPDLSKAATSVIGTGDLIRVNTLKPISYQFIVGMNEVPNPIEFIDPVTREKKSESILTWPGVRHLIEAGVFEAVENVELGSSIEPKAEKNKKGKTLEDISESA